MRKKATVLLTVCILIMVVVSLELRVVRPAGQAQDENPRVAATSSPVKDSIQVGATSLNEEVVLEGNLTGPVGHIPEGAPPWNYELVSNGSIVGVFWNCSDDYDSVNVRVYGVVKEGRLGGGLCEFLNGSTWSPPICYYVEADRVELF